MSTIKVLLSSYNGDKYIEDQVESILQQKVDCDLELIIRDDGSSDETISILDKLCEKHSNITFVKGKNLGVNHSFFELIKMAGKSEYYAISDQDDIWLPEKLQIAIDCLENDKNLLLYGSASMCVDENLDYISINPIIKRNITIYNTMIQNFIGGHTQVFTYSFAQIILKNYDLNKIFAYDAYFTNVAAIYSGLYFDTNSYVKYRLHANNLVGTGTNFYDWIKKNINRVKKGQSHEYAKQFEYITFVYKDKFSREELQECQRFLKSRKNIVERFVYACCMKFYRQSLKETFVFKLLYILGGWN